jgi:hypothetical protein
MAEISKIDVEQVARLIRRFGPQTAAMLGKQLGRAAGGIQDFMKRNERTPANPGGAFVRVLETDRVQPIRWDLAEKGA